MTAHKYTSAKSRKRGKRRIRDHSVTKGLSCQLRGGEERVLDRCYNKPIITRHISGPFRMETPRTSSLQKFPINEFRLFAHGPAFDPDVYLATTTLKFDGVWRKGELRRDHPKSSGVFKVLGDGPTLPLFEQERIAIAYLSTNREALQVLARTPGVTTFILGLQYHIQLEEGMVGFVMGTSAPLMKLALEIGISPTFYVTMDRREKSEASAES